MNGSNRLLLGSCYVALLLLNTVLSTAVVARPPTIAPDAVVDGETTQPTPLAQGQQQQGSMSIWQFINKVIRRIAPADAEVMNEFEETVRKIVLELDKQQAAYGNKTVVYTITHQRLLLNNNDDDDGYYKNQSGSDLRDTGEIFQNWLEHTFHVAYEWARSSTEEDYRQTAKDFKAARDWVRGLAAFNHFTDKHVEIIAKFVQNLPGQPQWRRMTTANVLAAFKQYLRDQSASWELHDRVRRQAFTEDDFDLMMFDDEFRSVYMAHRNITNWWDYILVAIDYIEDAVVSYNRLQTILWPPKMAISFAYPPIKFIWTGIDIAACLFEEFYELIIALETEERWWDVFLCSMELLGVIPGGGAIKFGLRIGIRLLKFITGIHTVPWYITMPWGWFKGWWWPESVNGTTIATTTMAAIAMTTTSKPKTTFKPTPLTSKPLTSKPRTTSKPATTKPTTTTTPPRDPYNWNKATTKKPGIDITEDFDWDLK